jgi:hypothetical protein
MESTLLDKEIFSCLLKIYKSEGDSGKDLFSFSKNILQKLLSEKAFERLENGDSPLGQIRLYGGSLGQYHALNIANGDFYERLKAMTMTEAYQEQWDIEHNKSTK